jgi:hypothetical protein
MNAYSHFGYLADANVLLQTYSKYLESEIIFPYISLNIQWIEKYIL